MPAPPPVLFTLQDGIVQCRRGAVAQDVLGEESKPIIISDRFPGYE
jgi:hypothetical protein